MTWCKSGRCKVVINRLYWKFNVLWDCLKCYWLSYSLTAVHYWVIETKTSTGNICLNSFDPITCSSLQWLVLYLWPFEAASYQRKFSLLYCKCVKLNRAHKEWKWLPFEMFYNFGDFSFLWDYVKCCFVNVKLHVLYKMYLYFIAGF